MQIFKTTTRARYAETDTSGIVYYASYFVYLEVGRIEMFRELGLPYDKRLPIAETYCRYHAPARFDDELEIHTFVEGLRSKGFRLGGRVYRREAERGVLTLLVEGYTAMVTTDEQGKPCPLPPAFREAFGAAMGPA